MRTRTELPTGAVIGDRYRIDGVLAAGAMSVVYSAWDPVLRREVALKALDARGTDAAPVGRSMEARLGASFDHWTMTSVFDAGTHRLRGGLVFDWIVMELATGGDLRTRLLGGPLPWRDAVRIGIDVCEALATLHAAGYLHRDVKPANVLLVRSGTEEVHHGKLADFGISSARDDDRSGGLGTAAYISPEQVQGDPLTEQSDVYALGLVLLEALTGCSEFPGSVDETAFARVRHDPVVPATVPPPVAAAVRAMTSQVPAHRPDAASAARRLRGVLHDDARRAAATRTDRDLERAHELAVHDVLGWPPLRAFAAATAIARRLLVTRYACVIMCTDRGLFVSSPTRGLRLPDRSPAGGWLRDDTHDRPWSIEDLAADRLTRDDALLAGAGVRAFAGAPLCGPTGARIATLCVFDDRPRSFSSQALDDLAALGGLVLEELELRLAARRAALAR